MPATAERARPTRLSFACADQGVRTVHLDCDRAVPGPRAFVRDGEHWHLDLALPSPTQLARLEYRFRLRGPGADLRVLDPANPRWLRSVFGDRSELVAPSYAEPWWLRSAAQPGDLATMMLDGGLVGPLPIMIWQPLGSHPTTPLPLLLVHDGPEYDQLARITRYSGALIEARVLPPHRLALAHPVARDSWYSASSAYVRAMMRGLGQIEAAYAVCAPIVVMGASLGGLTSVLLGLAGEPSIGGVFSQSGSFFQRGSDAMESDYSRFGRIVSRVKEVSTLRRSARSLRVGMTCGVLEENSANNRAMATALADAGHAVDLAEVPDLHNYTAWRDALDPHLTRVLTELWT